jgi:hypothetical protein
MDNHHVKRPQPAFTLWPMVRIGPAAARAGRALGVAPAMLGAGKRLVPLGDNRQLLAELAARLREANLAGQVFRHYPLRADPSLASIAAQPPRRG